MGRRLYTGTVLAAIILLMLLGVYFIYAIAPLVLLVLIAVVLTAAIDPPAKRLQGLTRRRFHLPRSLAVLVVLVAAILIFLGILGFLITTAVVDSIAFAHNTWPTLQRDLLQRAESLSHRYRFIPPPEVWQASLKGQSSRLFGYLWSTGKTVFGVLGGFASVLVVIVLTFFFAVYTEGISHTLVRFISPRHRARVAEVSHLAMLKMGAWVRGQLTLAIIIAVLILLITWALGVPYAGLIAIIGGLGELIPMVGVSLALVASIVSVLLAGAGLAKLLAVVAALLVLSLFEGYVLSPRIMERVVGLAPVTTILALLIGANLLGIVGALLAVPLAAAGRVVMLELVFPAIEGQNGSEPALADSQ